MADILQTIVANKREEIALQQKETSVDQLYAAVGDHLHDIISMSKRLGDSQTGIIAEFKRRSPSKGWIHRDADPQKVTAAYEQAGASALSILTDSKFFGGTMRDVCVSRGVGLPILRKDFCISEYQLHQARAIGADAVLLIAACLSIDECRKLARIARSIGLETLLEVHSPQEIEYVNDDISIIGVNNRHLGTFVTNVETSEAMASLLPKGILRISESGIHDAKTVARLRGLGYRGFLMGEHFMKHPDPAKSLADFISSLNSLLSEEQ